MRKLLVIAVETNNTKVQTLGARNSAHTHRPIDVDKHEKLANTTTAERSMRYIATHPGNGYNSSVTG